MSSNQDRPKLVAKRPKKRNKSRPKIHRDIQEDSEQNIGKKGVKRRFIDKEEPSSKKFCPPNSNKDESCSKISVNNRLTSLRENMKEGVKEKAKLIIISTNEGERKVSLKQNTSITSNNDQKPCSSKKSPNKNIASERLRRVKENLHSDSMSPNKLDITPSQKLSGSCLKHESPLKRGQSQYYSQYPENKIKRNGFPEDSFSASGLYVVSEASDTETSTHTVTPISERLKQIRNSSVKKNNNTDDSDNNNLTSTSFNGFNQTLNIFKVQASTPVQTDTNIFGSSSTKKNLFPNQQRSNTSQNIFGSSKESFKSNVSQNYEFNQTIKQQITVLGKSPILNRGGKISITERLAKIKQENKASIDSLGSSLQKESENQGRSLAQSKTMDAEGQNMGNVGNMELKHELISKSGSIFNNQTSETRNPHLSNPSSSSIFQNRCCGSQNSNTQDLLNFETSSPQDQCQKCSKRLMTENWIEGHECVSKNFDSTMSDSIIVNVDDTILNKSELPDPEDLSMEWDSVPPSSEVPVVPESIQVPKDNAICVVTDTNIFMHFLHKIKDIMNFKVTGSKKVKIYIPWMVINELDYIKDHSGEPAKFLALTAAKFISKCLSESNPCLIGQTVQDMAQQKDIGISPDDKILSSCIQAAEKYETVFLLSNDINLKNKAMINNIIACSPNDILPKLMSKLMKNTKSQKITLKLGIVCSQIICESCKETYGDAWSKMDMMQNPPWSLVECLKRFKRYWHMVFKEKLLKQCLKTVEDFYDLLVKNRNHISDESDTFIQFMKFALGFCMFLKDLPRHKGTVQNTQNEIIKIGNS